MKKFVNEQVGGTHYKNLPYQPVELFAKTKCTAFQANIWKYIVRYKYKNGQEDLEKAIHYAELALELRCTGNFGVAKRNEVIRFCNINALSLAQREIVLAVAWDNYLEIINKCKNLIKSEYA